MLNASKLHGRTSTASETPIQRTRSPNRFLDKMAPLPPIDLIEARLPDQLISSQLRQYNRPNQPVQTATRNYRDADDAVQVVGQSLVNGDAVLGRHEGCDDQVDVADEEKDRDGEGGAEGRVPVVLLLVGVEPDEAEGDEGVYYGEGVGDYAGEEVSVSVSMRFLVVDRGVSYLRMKLYASPGGGASMMITDTSQCSNRPASGALNGRLLAKKRE
jgi:hypothetical protein